MRRLAALHLAPDLTPTTTAAYGSAAGVPPIPSSPMSGWRTIGLDELRPWPDALTAYLHEKGHLP